MPENYETGEIQFFRELTLRICGSLDIEKALENTLLYLSNVMPVDECVLTSYDPEMGTLEIVATADSRGAEARSDRIVLSPQLRREIEDAEHHPRVRIADDAKEDPFFGLVARHLGWEDSSVMVGRLMLEGNYIGTITVRASGKGKYSDEHLRLWEMVNEPAAVALANSKRYREVWRLKNALADDKKYLQNELRRTSGVEVIGADFGLKEVMEKVRKVAYLPSPVLLQGETGTGKEVIANAIHSLSTRSEGPFIKVNCGAIPDTLIDSELFGHEKGAFTGALAQKRGRFERAHGGSIFLDEIGELPLQAQVRLLRVIQEKEIERVGGTGPVKIDVRIISASNRDLDKLMGSGAFREDLYFRLRVFPISLPPLRERKADIPDLVHHFIYKKSREMALPAIPTLGEGAIDALMAYHWPGNVRELENAVERAIILSGGLPLNFDKIIGNQTNPCDFSRSEKLLKLKDMEATHIRRALESAHGRVEGEGGAARLLGLNPGTLRHRMRKLGIPFGRAATR